MCVPGLHIYLEMTLDICLHQHDFGYAILWECYVYSQNSKFRMIFLCVNEKSSESLHSNECSSIWIETVSIVNADEYQLFDQFYYYCSNARQNSFQCLWCRAIVAFYRCAHCAHNTRYKRTWAVHMPHKNSIITVRHWYTTVGSSFIGLSHANHTDANNQTNDFVSTFIAWQMGTNARCEWTVDCWVSCAEYIRCAAYICACIVCACNLVSIVYTANNRRLYFLSSWNATNAIFNCRSV